MAQTYNIQIRILNTYIHMYVWIHIILKNINSSQLCISSLSKILSANMVVILYVKQDWVCVFLSQYIMWDNKNH